MKTISAIAVLLFVTGVCFAQEPAGKSEIAAAQVKTLDGKTINTSTFSNNGKPMIIDFWATWCKPCVAELNAISEEYTDWKEETGVKLIAISIDDARTMASVAPFIAGKGWEYEIFLDPNSDFRRAMNVNNVPHTFLIDGTGKIVAQHNTYSPGDENELHEELKKLSGK